MARRPESKRRTFARLNYQVLQSTMRREEIARHMALIATRRPSEIAAPVEPRGCADYLADYNPLGHFGAAWRME